MAWVHDWPRPPMNFIRYSRIEYNRVELNLINYIQKKRFNPLILELIAVRSYQLLYGLREQPKIHNHVQNLDDNELNRIGLP